MKMMMMMMMGLLYEGYVFFMGVTVVLSGYVVNICRYDCCCCSCGGRGVGLLS